MLRIGNVSDTGRSGGGCAGREPVSYTHLDVYKRQVVGIAEGKEEAMDMMTLIVMDCLEQTGGVKVKDFIMEQMD